MAGATASATTGSDGLEVTMKAKVAVLCIVGVKKGDCSDINVKTDDQYVSGLVADKKSAGFSVKKSDAKVTLLSNPDAGVYYVVVPAGVKLSVYNGTTHIKTTKEGGLTAGKYYTLKTGANDGEEDAIINGETVKMGWVQLWPGGPKFATENVAKAMTWADATKTDDAYVWGKNWRTPTKEELNFVDPKENESNHWILNPLNTKAEIYVQNGKAGILYTGIQPGYTDKSIFLPLQFGDSSHFFATYCSSTVINQGFGVSLGFTGGDDGEGKTVLVHYSFDEEARTSTGTTYLVRPVLNE